MLNCYDYLVLQLEDSMKFEWDEKKNNIKIEKHGLDLRDVKLAFNSHTKR